MDITIVTTASTDAEGRALLLAMGFPFDTTQSRGQVSNGEESAHQQAAAQAQVQGAGATPGAAGAAGRAAVFRKFGLCRVCLRELAHAGELPGVTKASW